jgi:hypothetical protein
VHDVPCPLRRRLEVETTFHVRSDRRGQVELSGVTTTFRQFKTLVAGVAAYAPTTSGCHVDLVIEQTTIGER